MEINISNPKLLFSFFYIFSFTAISFIAVIFSQKRQIPVKSVLLILTITTLMTITGSRLFTIPVSEWGQSIITDYSSTHSGRSAIGGFLFGLTGFLISTKIFSPGPAVLVFYAWVTPLGLGIQKIGCFMNGCCYGVLTNSELGVLYPKGTCAHFSHLIRGIISNNSLVSHKVFPIQIVELLVYFMIALLVYKTRTIWKKNLSIIVFSSMLLFLSRFLTEFFRDPARSPFNDLIYGIRTLQWFLLFSGLFCGVLLLLFEKALKADFYNVSFSEPGPGKTICSLLSLSLIIFVLHSFLSFYEKTSLFLIFIPAVVSVLYVDWFLLPGMEINMARISVLIVPFLMIYPTMNTDTLKSTRPKKEYYDNEIKSYKKVDAGASFGKYYSTIYYNPHQGECGTSYTSEDYEHIFTMAGGGYSVVKISDASVETKGINIFGGINDEHNLTKQTFNSYFIGGITPYIKYDRKWIGLGFGLDVGNLRWVVQSHLNETSFNKGTRFSPVMPEINFRVGRRDILDVTYSYGFNNYTAFPVLASEISLGSGFGQKTDLSLRLGTLISEINSNTFISGEWVIEKKLGINFKYHFGTYSEYNPYWYYPVSQSRSPGILIIGASYRFGFEK
jgi:phosphatidylglycerol:prolipoprotein diacylglycerol transferase